MWSIQSTQANFHLIYLKLNESHSIKLTGLLSSCRAMDRTYFGELIAFSYSRFNYNECNSSVIRRENFSFGGAFSFDSF